MNEWPNLVICNVRKSIYLMKEIKLQNPALERTGDAASDQARADANRSRSSYSTYLFGSSGTLERPALSDSAQGRAMIRLVSRGIVGAAFFTLGGHYATRAMKNYNPDPNKFHLDIKNPLQAIAYGIDHGPWKGITGNSRFRRKTFYTDIKVDGHLQPGRSYGAEIVGVTFDFFSASIGDAMTRNFFQALDKNVAQPWFRDANGNKTTRDLGKFDLGEWGKATARASWRVFSRNALEDWAAAPIYVYQMKLQRHFISHIGQNQSGFGAMLGMKGAGATITLDSNMAGGGALVKRNKETGAHDISGGYQWQGALDLHARFVGYNWYTLMYRNAYDAVGKGFTNWKDHGFSLKLPEVKDPVGALGKGVADSARYLARSFIKTNLYMQPAVIPFWLFRVPQSKRRGVLISEDLAIHKPGVAVNKNASAIYTTEKKILDGKRNSLGDLEFASNPFNHAMPRTEYIHGGAFPTQAYLGNELVTKGNFLGRNPEGMRRHPFRYNGVKRNWFDHILNPFGYASYAVGHTLAKGVDMLPNSAQPGFVSKALFNTKGNWKLDREKMVHDFADASMSYTPYMWAKAETALLVDDEYGRMDKAIDGLITNTVKLNFSGIKQSIGDMVKLGTNFERGSKSREGAVDHRPVATDMPDSTGLKTVPTTKVSGGSVSHVAKLNRANDNERADNDQHDWAHTVAGQRLDAAAQAGKHTIH